MSNETIIIPSQKEVFINMGLSAWKAENKKLDKLLDKLSDDQFLKETAPGRNSGIYLVGHLVAVNDDMLRVLGFGERSYPQLHEIFITNPDNAGLAMPSMTELKKYWNEINDKLMQHMDKMQPDDWFSKHAAVSAEDFAKEPHRNKLNIILSRTTHQSYHLGQLAYLDQKAAD